jgi:hypothetical protein
LPDRSTAGTANWLKQHPEVEIISRDRCGSFAQGAREGAPQARQVADRFHILQNLREAIQLQLSRASGSSVCPLLPETDGSDERDVMISPRPYVRRVLVARPRGKQGSGVALDRPEPSPKLSEGGP